MTGGLVMRPAAAFPFVSFVLLDVRR